MPTFQLERTVVTALETNSVVRTDAIGITAQLDESSAPVLGEPRDDGSRGWTRGKPANLAGRQDSTLQLQALKSI